MSRRDSVGKLPRAWCARVRDVQAKGNRQVAAASAVLFVGGRISELGNGCPRHKKVAPPCPRRQQQGQQQCRGTFRSWGVGAGRYQGVAPPAPKNSSLTWWWLGVCVCVMAATHRARAGHGGCTGPGTSPTRDDEPHQIVEGRAHTLAQWSHHLSGGCRVSVVGQCDRCRRSCACTSGSHGTPLVTAAAGNGIACTLAGVVVRAVRGCVGCRGPCRVAP